jgi:hypothetical protein
MKRTSHLLYTCSKEARMESMREMIEKRAYELFLKRGGVHGYHSEDWLKAEKEIKAEIEAKKKNESKQPFIQKTAPKKDPIASASKAAPAPNKPALNNFNKVR